MQYFTMNPPDLRIPTPPLRNICLTAFLIALASLTWAARAESTATEPAKPPVPILTTDEKIQAELNSLNQFLDTNPQVEDTLRANVDKATDAGLSQVESRVGSAPQVTARYDPGAASRTRIPPAPRSGAHGPHTAAAPTRSPNSMPSSAKIPPSCDHSKEIRV